MLLQATAVLVRPANRQWLGWKDFLEHEIAVLHDAHFDRQTRGAEDATHVRRTAAKTPQHTGTGFHVETTHGFLDVPTGHATRLC